MTANRQKRQVVVITDHLDAHLPFVQAHLDAPMIVIDPLQYAKGATLSFSVKGSKNVVTYDGTVLDKVTGIWYRKPRAIEQASLPVDKDFQEYACTQLQMHYVQLLTSFPDARWVSNYYTLLSANDKTLQLTVASGLGFNTPDTLFTSDASAAKSFIDRHSGVVMKSINALQVERRGVHKILYTSRIDKSRIPSLDNLHVSPLIFQQIIEPGYDVRVTVVGDRVFPATIRNTEESTAANVRDWRMGRHEGEMVIEEYTDFPKDIAKLCIRHVKALGLSFGAIDLMVDKKGKMWFLENNPNGQWAFVEKMTGQPIGKAMAELLTKGRVGQV